MTITGDCKGESLMSDAETEQPGEDSDDGRREEVTLRVDRRVLRGEELAFEKALDHVLKETAKAPGYIGNRVIRPSRGSRDFRFLFRFDSRENLEDWLQSEEEARCIAPLDAHSEGDYRLSDITGTAQESPLAVALTPLEQYFRGNVSAIGLLLLGALVALVIANTPLGESYERLWTTSLSLTVGDYQISETLRNLINDGFMALFFFTVGLEIKRQVLVGEMQHPPLAWLAVAAALGGVVFPALVYLGVNTMWDGTPGGWGIPVGTDTAFALGLMSLFGNRVQPSLIAFLTAFSIVDDILAVLVIAVFYTASINWYALGIAAIFLIGLGVANYAGIQRWSVFGILGLGVWIAIFESGVHSTMAGILVAFTIPARAWIHPTDFIDRGQKVLDYFKKEQGPGTTTLNNEALANASYSLERLATEVEAPMNHMQHLVGPWVNYIILPVFALANANIPILNDLGVSLSSPVMWGVVAGLLLGKPIGITLISWLTARFGPAELPKGVTWHHIAGIGLLGGIGFTMSLFVTSLAFPPGPTADAARIGMLIASVLSGILAYVFLNRTLPDPDNSG